MKDGILTVLGCGGSSGVPRIGNDWGVCDPAEPRNTRTRASVVIQNGADAILIDTGPDLRIQMNREEIKNVTHVFYTHVHSDHVNGIDDLRGYYHLTKKPIPVYSTADNIMYLQERFDYMFRDLPPYYPMALAPNLWTEGDLYKTQRVGQTDFTVFQQDHEGMKTLGFRFGDVAYSTDMMNLEDAAIDVLRGVKVWIADGNNYYFENMGPHANKARLEELNAKIGADLVYITHMKNNIDYRALRADVPPGYRVAFDGLKIRLDGTVLNDDAGQ